MQSPLKKKKLSKTQINMYMKALKDSLDHKIGTIQQNNNGLIKFAKNGKNEKNEKKQEQIAFDIVTNYNSHWLFVYKWGLADLKKMATLLHLKTSGSIHELTNRLHIHCLIVSSITKIQAQYRRHLVQSFFALQGPARFQRKLCTNEHDFITMEPFTKQKQNLKPLNKDINVDVVVVEEPYNFYSYQDSDNFIYGFKLTSMYDYVMVNAKKKEIVNPFNRSVFTLKMIGSILQMQRLYHLLHFKERENMGLDLESELETSILSKEKLLELNYLDLFQRINHLGNYSDSKWLLGLNKKKTIRFVQYLMDIWEYRSELSPEMKRLICPPTGNPFMHLSIPQLIHETSLFNIQERIYSMLNKLVNVSATTDNQSLGAIYILGALSIVNPIVASALPMLYESFYDANVSF